MSAIQNHTEYLLSNYNEDIVKIYNTYQNLIRPFIVQLEILDGEFPVEILNEIRAIFQHIIKCYSTDSDDEIKKNISKAKSHLKRAALDCFKYTCVSFDEEYKGFLHQFRGVDLSAINGGEFLYSIRETYQQAKDLLRDAKESEAMAEDAFDSFSLFEKAYNKYCDLHKIINANESYARVARKKQYLKRFISVLGWIVSAGLSAVGIYVTLR